jgi:hypothetical protein
MIKRLFAEKDTTISNAFKSNLTTRATGSNMGESDVLDIFSLYGQESSSSLETERIMVKFDLSAITTERTAGNVPASGSVKHYLRLFNAEHSNTLPKKFYTVARPLTRSWQEGFGLDMDGYTDNGTANWEYADDTTQWTTDGGDYLNEDYVSYFENGTENLEVDVSHHVEECLKNNRTDYGFIILLSGSFEDGSQQRSFYKKSFFARNSEFFHRRPLLETRWDSSIQDKRNDFYASSSLVPAADNVNTIYLYNNIRGQLKDIPYLNKNLLQVRFEDYDTGTPISASDPTTNQTVTHLTGGLQYTGIYSASVVLNTTSDIVKDIWYSGSTAYYTGTVVVKRFESEDNNPIKGYVASINNLKSEYSIEENPRLRLFIRNRDWSPTIYSVAYNQSEATSLSDCFYKVVRTIDNEVVIDYGTGSTNHTKTSFDSLGNYFDLDMSWFEPNYQYTISFLYNDFGQYKELKDKFKFRVA